MRNRSFRLLFAVIDNAQKDVYTGIDTECTAVEADIVVLCYTPGSAGVVLVIHFAALVFFLQTHFGTLFGFAVESDDTVSAEGHIRMDIGM